MWWAVLQLQLQRRQYPAAQTVPCALRMVLACVSACTDCNWGHIARSGALGPGRGKRSSSSKLT